jgi:hypothetical protein
MWILESLKIHERPRCDNPWLRATNNLYHGFPG